MPPRKKTSASADGGSAKSNGATLGFEAKLWEMAGKLRDQMDAATSRPS